MKSVFPNKDVFNNYDLNLTSTENTILEFVLEQYPEYIFSIETKLRNRIVLEEKNKIFAEKRTREYCTIIVETARQGDVDIPLLEEKFPYMVFTNKMIKSLNSEIVLEYKNEMYNQLPKQMAVLLLELALFGIVDESVFTIVNKDTAEIVDMDYTKPKKEEEEEEDNELE